MTNETRRRLLDVLLACRLIARYTAGLDIDAYEADELIRDGVERRLGIIGEALNRAAVLEPALVARVPELRQIVAMRNRVIHAYDAVDHEVVWDVVANKLPSLQIRVAELLAEGDPGCTP